MSLGCSIRGANVYDRYISLYHQLLVLFHAHIHAPHATTLVHLFEQSATHSSSVQRFVFCVHKCVLVCVYTEHAYRSDPKHCELNFYYHIQNDFVYFLVRILTQFSKCRALYILLFIFCFSSLLLNINSHVTNLSREHLPFSVI